MSAPIGRSVHPRSLLFLLCSRRGSSEVLLRFLPKFQVRVGRLGEVKPGKVAYESGSKLVSEELLLEVNETPVAGLTIRDVLAVIKHCKDPLRLKCVKQGERGGSPGGRTAGRVGSPGKGVCCRGAR